MAIKRDNSELLHKVRLRRSVLSGLEEPPIVLEAYGGWGTLYKRCYWGVDEGAVFEADRAKAEALAWQRPTWAVYEGDCVQALAAGVGDHLQINFLDVDPYGEPWPCLDAWFTSRRPRAGTLGIVVTDGLRQKIQIDGGWSVASLAEVVERHGADHLYRNYLAIAAEMLAEKAAAQGYKLSRWAGFYGGHAQAMAYYGGVLIRG